MVNTSGDTLFSPGRGATAKGARVTLNRDEQDAQDGAILTPAVQWHAR